MNREATETTSSRPRRERRRHAWAGVRALVDRMRPLLDTLEQEFAGCQAGEVAIPIASGLRQTWSFPDPPAHVARSRDQLLHLVERLVGQMPTTPAEWDAIERRLWAHRAALKEQFASAGFVVRSAVLIEVLAGAIARLSPRGEREWLGLVLDLWAYYAGLIHAVRTGQVAPDEYRLM
jgi:hypothetical protein